MKKKTIEQYKQEFKKILKLRDEKERDFMYKWTHEDVVKYEHFAKDCIADYPNDDLGYIEYGKSFYEFSITDETEIENKVKEIASLTKQNKKYIKTEQSFLENFPVLNIADIVRDLIYKEKTTDYAEIYFLLGKLYANYGTFNYAIEDFAVAHQLGIDYKRFINVLNPTITSIYVSDFFCFKDEKALQITNLKDKKEIYFLGENGVGKTLLLQAIVLGMIKNDIIGRKKIYNNFDFETYAKNMYNSIGIEVDVETQKPYNYQNLFAYGVGRFISGPAKDESFATYGIETLFKKKLYLTDTLTWLNDLIRVEQDGNANISLRSVLVFLEHILNIEGNAQINIQYNKKISEFIFYENGIDTPIEHLADGYSSMLILLCDLLRRFIENQPYITDIKDFHGIVLIDEIDMFLHPKWEYKIVRLLRKELPNIQWFFTTHSPMLILGASSENAVFYKLYRENKTTKISEPWYTNDLLHLMANGIITSPLFDMETAQMPDSKNIDTDLTYWHSEINRIIKQKIESKKIAGKSYFSKDEVKQIVDWAIKQIEEGENEKD